MRLYNTYLNPINPLTDSIFLKSKLCFVFLFLFNLLSAQTVILTNRGADIKFNPGVDIILKTGSLSNSGYIANETHLIVEGSIANLDTLEGIGTAVFELTGNWSNNAVFIAGQSNVILSGANQNIAGTATTTFYDLTLEGTGIKSTSANAKVSHLLNLNDRELSTSNRIVTVTNPSPNSIIRSTGFVSSLSGGFLERAMNDTLDYLFPLGSQVGTSRYRPLVMMPSDTGLTTLGGRLANLDATSEGFDRNNTEQNICDINPFYYHQINRVDGAQPINLTFFYDPVDDGSWSQIVQWKNTPRWEKAGLAVQGFDTTAFNLLTVEDWSDFSFTPFGLMLPEPSLDTTQTVINNITCHGGTDGSISVSFPPQTGTPPFFYIWSTEDTTATITGLSAGEYTLTIIDGFSCLNTYTFTITEPNPINVIPNVSDVSCRGDADGEICLSVSGDFPPFTYQWSLPGGSTCLVGLQAGNYSVTVRDNDNCTRILLINVGEPDLLVAIAEGADVSCYGFNDGIGSVTVNGGTPPFSYFWSTNETTDVITNLEPGFYDLTVTDINNCTATSTMSLTQPDSLIVGANSDQTVFTGYTAPIEVVLVQGGKGEVTYEWTPVTGVANPLTPNTTATPDESTTYTITVTDENDCKATDMVRVQVDVNLYTFPEAFVPRGTNNIYAPVISATVQVLKLQIYNRWGQLVSDNSSGWDGIYSGTLQPMDTYIYQAVLQLPDGSQKTERGDFILVR